MYGKSPAWRTAIYMHTCIHIRTHTQVPPTPVSPGFPARPSRGAVGGAQRRAPPPTLGRAPPSPQRTPPAASARAAPALPYWLPRSRAGRPLARTEQGAARGGAPEQSVIGRRRAPTFPPVPRAAPPPRRAAAAGCEGGGGGGGGGRSPGGRSRHSGREPGWGQRRHTRRLPPRGKGREAERRPCGERARRRRPALPGEPLRFPAAAPPAHPAWCRDLPGFLFLPRRRHLVYAAAEPGARTRAGTQAQEAARRGPALPTGSRRLLSLLPSLPRLSSPACPTEGSPHGRLSYSPPQQLQSPAAIQPLQPPPPQPDLPPAVPPILGRPRTCPGDPPAAPSPGTPSIPAAPTPPGLPPPRDARVAHRRSRGRPEVPPPLSRFSSFCSPLPTRAAAPPGPRAGGWAGPPAARRPIAGKGVWGGGQ
ncbi:uncharacterized protein [Aphelocoma coerulescens]|uniref:uncharacterized protein n=1 Tax=Aphelocoma coerulescens TaxID=39617 RepID=UPI003604810D